MSAAHIYPFLQPLLLQLEAEGFAISMDTLLRIEYVLRNMGKQYRQQPEKLKLILCPIVANSEPEQVKFNRIFDLYVQQLKASETLPELPVSVAPVKSGKISAKTIVLLIGLIGIAFAAGIVLVRLLPQQPAVKEVIVMPPPQPAAVCPANQKPPTFFEASEKYPAYGQTVTFTNQTKTNQPVTYEWNFGSGESVQSDAPTITHAFYQTGAVPVSLYAYYPQTQNPTCDSLYSTTITIAAPQQKIDLPPMYPQAETNMFHLSPDWSKPIAITAIWALLLALLLLAGLWYDKVKTAAKQAANQLMDDFLRRQQEKNAKGGKEPPFHIPFPPQDAHIEAAQEIYDVAAAMRQRQSSETMRLHLAKTIQQTIRSGGMPTLHYARQSQATEYLALINHTCQNDHRARFFEHFIDALARENVLIEKYFFRHDPRHCWNAAHPDGIVIEDIAKLHPKHRLLILDDGDYLINPLRPQLKEWVNQTFETWSKRAFVTPADPEQWTYRERLLSELFVVIPANLQGQAQLAELLSADETAEFTKLKTRFLRTQRHLPMPVRNAQDTNIDWNALQQYLTVQDQNGYPSTALFTLLCALSCFEPITWEVTLAIAKELKDKGIVPPQALTHNNLLLLARLPWLQEAQMPQPVRAYLAEQLKLMPEVELLARKAAIELLDSIELKPGSFARRKKEQFLTEQLQQSAATLATMQQQQQQQAAFAQQKANFSNISQSAQTAQTTDPTTDWWNNLQQWWRKRLLPDTDQNPPDAQTEYNQQLRNQVLWRQALAQTLPQWGKYLPLFLVGIVVITALGLPIFVIAALYLLYTLATRQTQKAALPVGVLLAALPGVALWASVVLSQMGYTQGYLYQSLAEDPAATRINEGVKAFYQNDLATAETAFTEAYNTSQNYALTTYNLAATYYTQGLRAYYADDYDIAIKSFKRAAPITDSSELRYNIWHNLGVCYQLLSVQKLPEPSRFYAPANATAAAYYDSLNNANAAYYNRFAPNLASLLYKKQMTEYFFPPRKLPADSLPITAYAIANNGTLLLIGHNAGQCRLWHLPSLTPLHTFGVSVGKVTSLAFSAQAQLKAAGGEEGFAVWNMNGEEIINTQEFGGVSQIAFSPDDRYFAINLLSGGLRLFAIGAKSFSAANTFATPANPVAGKQVFTFSASGKWLAYINQDSKSINIFDIPANKQIAQVQAQGKTDAFAALAFSPDEQWLATATQGGILALYQTNNNFIQTQQTELKEGFTGSISFLPDGKLLAGMQGYRPMLWNAQTLQTFYQFTPNNQLLQTAFSPDGLYIVQHSADTGRLSLYHTALYKNAFFEEPQPATDYLYIRGVVKDTNGNPVPELGIAEKSNTESMETVTNAQGEFIFQYPKQYFRENQTLTFELRYPPQWKLVSPNPLKMRLAAEPQNPPIAVIARNDNNMTNNPCNNIQCLNGGNCVNGICECINGYTGNRCQNPPARQSEAEAETQLIENLRSMRKFDRVADRFSSGLLLVQNGGKYFYLNRTGNPAFPNVYYDQAADFTDGTAKVTLNGKTYYIDRTGKCVRDCNTRPSTSTSTQQTEQPPQQNQANLCQGIDCGAYGYCNPQTGKCICTNGYTGDRCQNPPK